MTAMKRLLPLALSLAVGAGVLAAEKDQPDLKTHQGTWKPIAAVLLGKRLPKEELDKITLKIEGEQYTVTVVGEEKSDHGTFTIDSSVKPHRMTIKGVKGPNAGKTILAIFEHKHKDAMRVCYDLSGKEFPKVFRVKARSTHYLVGYRRKKAP